MTQLPCYSLLFLPISSDDLMRNKYRTPMVPVTPTYNRPHYLARALDYYSRKHLRYPIIVADASTLTEM